MNNNTFAALCLVVTGILGGPNTALANEQQEDGMLQASQLSAHDRYRLATADPVDQQLATYSRQLPEMGFLRLYGESAASMVIRLPELLGEGAANVDYEHQPSQRQDVFDAQMRRIGIMLSEDMPSATLFRTGKGSAFDHRYLCVITLNSEPYRRDKFLATRLMVSGHDKLEREVVNTEVVNNSDFLRFTVDHEVYHCLSAYFDGPSFKMTDSNIYSHYQHYLAEAEADAFAAIAFKQAVPVAEKFLRKMAAFRTVSPMAMDFQHFTGEVILRSMRTSMRFDSLTIGQIVEVSRELAAEVAPTATGFGNHLANTIALVRQLGGDPRTLLHALEGELLPRHDELEIASLKYMLREAEAFLVNTHHITTQDKEKS